MPTSYAESYGNFGWLGFREEKKAKEINYQMGLMVDFSQWSVEENDIDFVELFNFPFDDGFAFWPFLFSR